MTQTTPPALANPITEDDIAHYLSITPDFFQRHAELLAAVQLTSPHGNRAVSLQERQAEMLREKIKGLEHRIMDMVRNGNENVLLSDKILRWTRSLFVKPAGLSLPEHLVLELTMQFSVPQVGLRLWDVAATHAGEDFAKPVSDDAKLFANSLTEPFCGLNTGFEAVSWLSDPQSVASLALVPLRLSNDGAPGAAFGMLVLASSDATRFNSNLGTDFLARIGEIASAALSTMR
ncbi:DUF484 family protein [Curvibacter sp. APW13]|uniref:DUF484 family protein n=1 Tax=Curvibacter sp. APW13 TaxID=3077236 RepID=UPI0028DDFCC8|nr:DUF484 family protein [Curvibacter sp. APW13]MDT8989816.1 DUF484 family protein [Curvibacter sp. APW13]